MTLHASAATRQDPEGCPEPVGEFAHPVLVPRLRRRMGLEQFYEALEDERFWVRQAAAQALGELEDGRAVEPLCTTLHDPNSSVRRAAAASLGRIGDGRAVGPLSEMLHDPLYWVRGTAAEALGLLGRREALPALNARLRPLVGESVILVRGAILTAIERIEPAEVADLPLPACAPPPTVHTLPRPAEPARPFPGALPHPSKQSISTVPEERL